MRHKVSWGQTMSKYKFLEIKMRSYVSNYSEPRRPGISKPWLKSNWFKEIRNTWIGLQGIKYHWENIWLSLSVSNLNNRRINQENTGPKFENMDNPK